MLHVPCHFVHLNSLMYHITFPGGTRKTTYVGYDAPPNFHCNHNNILYIHLYIIIYMSLDWEINFLYLVSCIMWFTCIIVPYYFIIINYACKRCVHLIMVLYIYYWWVLLITSNIFIRKMTLLKVESAVY